MKIGKYKLKFFLSSGQTVVVKCSSFSLTKLSNSKGQRSLNIDNADRSWSIDVDEIIAVTSKWCLF